ncbi:MAG: F-type H+-transporting ATPase subunit epsilon [Bacteroidota bacterium]|nr:F-type H+-transporting ATPase subunit epsilon [Bacteroidota bacterium]
MAEVQYLSLDIVTPQKTIYSGNVESVSVPGALSPFQILHNHAPIVSSLDLGMIKIIDSAKKTQWFVATTGFIEVIDNKISILVESAEDPAKADTVKLETLLNSTRQKLADNINPDDTEALKSEIARLELSIKAKGRYS